MIVAHTQLISRFDFDTLMEDFLWGSVSEELPEHTQIAHIAHGLLTVVLFENHNFVLVIKGDYEHPRRPANDAFATTLGNA